MMYLTEFVLEWETFQTKDVEKIKTHFMFNIFFSKIVPVMKFVEQRSRARQATEDIIIRRRKDGMSMPDS
jgi:hypothetical protein